MTRIQTACYCLLASAFVLGGLLAFQLRGSEPTAQAGLVIARDQFSLMTAKTRQNEEALWVLDNKTGRILIYQLQLSGARGGRLELSAGIDLASLFSQTRAGGEPGGGGSRR